MALGDVLPVVVGRPISDKGPECNAVSPGVVAVVCKEEDDVQRSASFVSRGNATVLLISFLTALSSGTAYGISAYQLLLMERYGFTGQDTDLCYTMAFLLNVFEPGGFLFASHGSFRAILYGVTFLMLGVLAMVAILGSLTAERWLGSSDVWILASCFGAVAHGSSVIYTTALFSAVHFFEGSPRQGTAIGLVSSGFGLSAAVWVGIYRICFNGNLQGFFTFFGIVYGMFILSFACCVYVPPPSNGHRRARGDKIKFMEARAGDENMEVSCEVEEEGRNEIGHAPSCACLGMVRPPVIFLFICSFSLVQGSTGGAVLGNVSLVARSLGASKKLAQTSVSLFAIANCAGRIGSGLVMDRWPAITKPTLMIFVGITNSLACALLASFGDQMPPELVCSLLLLPGFAYGAGWAIMPAHMASELGSHNCGVGFAVAAMCVAPVSSFFSMATGRLYDAKADEGSTVCIGAGCFRVALLIAMLACGAATLVALALRRVHAARTADASHELQADQVMSVDAMAS